MKFLQLFKHSVLDNVSYGLSSKRPISRSSMSLYLSRIWSISEFMLFINMFWTLKLICTQALFTTVCSIKQAVCMYIYPLYKRLLVGTWKSQRARWGSGQAIVITCCLTSIIPPSTPLNDSSETHGPFSPTLCGVSCPMDNKIWFKWSWSVNQMVKVHKNLLQNQESFEGECNGKSVNFIQMMKALQICNAVSLWWASRGPWVFLFLCKNFLVNLLF